jgi:hypothetical protein
MSRIARAFFAGMQLKQCSCKWDKKNQNAELEMKPVGFKPLGTVRED